MRTTEEQTRKNKGRYINAAQMLIRKQFPDIGELYCPSYGTSANFPKTASKRWLKIVHDGENHWVLIARGFPENLKGKEKETDRVDWPNCDWDFDINFDVVLVRPGSKLYTYLALLNR